MNNKIVCQKCVYYFVTWEPSRPHGCNAYGFKSQIIPSQVVKKTSNENCNFYTLKNNNMSKS